MSAEFIVVVVGVLVALAADSAMDGVRERAVRLEALQAVRGDVTADLAQLDTYRLAFIDEQRRAHEDLRAFLADDRPIADSVAFVRDVWLVGSYQTFDANTAAVEDLKSTGTLRLIHDAELRTRILTYYNIVEDVVEVDAVHRAATLNHVWSLGPKIVGGVALARTIESRFLNLDSDLERAAAATALDARRIRDDDALRELLVGAARGLAGQTMNYARLRTNGQALLDALEAAIG